MNLIFLVQLQYNYTDILIGTQRPLNITVFSALNNDYQKLKQKPFILRPPLTVYGDFHGSQHSMNHALSNKVQKLFLGDYMDRGSSSLFCLQAAIAQVLDGSAHALRGNHEDIAVNKRYGSLDEVKSIYGASYNDAVQLIQDIYRHLPLFMLIHSKRGAFFAVHGGISLTQRLASLFFYPNELSYEQLLWSDPASTYGLSPRGAGFNYDYKHFSDWAVQNGISIVLRGHQFVDDGFRDDFKNQQHFTVFSAGNYANAHNKGGYIQIDEAGQISHGIIE